MKRMLFFAIFIGAIAGLISGGILVAVHASAELTPYEIDHAKRQQLSKDIKAWETATAKGEQWSGTTEYVPPKPPAISAHPVIGGFVAGNVVALIAFLILLVTPFSSKSTTPPVPDLELLPDAGIRLLPPLPR